jgi:hypothetical protein
LYAMQASAQASDAEPQDGAPGIPPFLAQARNRPDDVAQVPLVYDADSALMPMGDLDAVLPDTNPLMNVGGISMVGVPGSVPSMFQQPIPQPSAGFLMAQQSVFGGDAYMDHYMNRQHGQGDYSQHPGGY